MHGAKTIKLAAAALLAVVAVSTAHAADNYKVVDNTIPQSLTGKAGDPASGKAVYLHRRKGNCLACHANKDMADQPFHGKIGPPIDGVASRYTEAELRMRLVDPKVFNDDTIMPSFYRTEGFHRVLKKFQGKTVLSAQEVEDVIAYLMTLKDE